MKNIPERALKSMLCIFSLSFPFRLSHGDCQGQCRWKQTSMVLDAKVRQFEAGC